MRLVIFTARSDLPGSSWWSAVTRTPGIEAILLCRQQPSFSKSDVLKRFRRNVSKHGLLFIPYRIVVGVWSKLKRDPAPIPHLPARNITIHEIVAPHIHAPEVVSQVVKWQPDLGLSLGAPILKPALFEIPPRGTLNVHLGKVPDFRGAPPAFWEMESGAKEIGATVHWVNAGLDTGDIVEQAVVPIYPNDSLNDVTVRADELGQLLLARALAHVIRGDAPRIAQPAGGQTNRIPVLKRRLATQARLSMARTRRTVTGRVVLKSLFYANYLTLFRPLRTATHSALKRHPVRIFTYHRVTDLCRDGMTVPRAIFADQMRYIAKHHDVLPLSRALALLRNKQPLRKPVAVITFDDGYRSVFTAAKPIMDELRITGTCFVVTDLVGTNRRMPHDVDDPLREFHDLMDWEEVTSLVESGWEVGAHTATHARMSALSPDDAYKELARPLETLRERFGLQEIAFAYPFGTRTDITDAVREQARQLGYAACLGNYGGDNDANTPMFYLNRKDLGGPHAALAWKAWVHGFST